MSNVSTQNDMPYHRHTPLGITRRLDVALMTDRSCSSSLLRWQGNAERNLSNQGRVETGRRATRLHMQGVKAQSDHQGNLGAAMRRRKEWINILFAGTRWGATKKAPKGFAAERVFINALLDPTIIGEDAYQELTVPDPQDAQKRVAKYPDFLFLTKYNETGFGPMFNLVTEPDDVETFIGHVTGPQGPRSNLTRVEVVRGATIHVDMQVLRDEIAHHHWPIILLTGQEEGLGAMRSQGYGRFDVVRFERTSGKYVNLDWDEIVKEVDTDAILRAYQLGKAALKESGEATADPTEGLVPLAAAAPTTNGKHKASAKK